MTATRPKLAALAVVVRDDQVLLVQRRNEPDAGTWGFPGGHVELGERALDAAVRELQEETGVIARARSYLTNIDVVQRSADGSVKFHFLLAAVLCTYQSGEPQAGDDAMAAGWVPFDEVEQGARHLSQNVVDVLRLARQQLS